LVLILVKALNGGTGVALIGVMEAYMKMSAVIILMVALFSGSAFASSCANSNKTSLFSSTKASSGSSSSGTADGAR
jgi:hypothetical protein